jgi:hypothetical protein
VRPPDGDVESTALIKPNAFFGVYNPINDDYGLACTVIVCTNCGAKGAFARDKNAGTSSSYFGNGNSSK